MKKLLSIILVAVMLFSVLPFAAMAEGEVPFELVATKSGDNVVVSLKTNATLTYANITVQLSISDPFTGTSLDKGEDYALFGANDPVVNVEEGIASITTTDNDNDTVVSSGKEFLVFTLDASAAEDGDYSFSLTVSAAGDIDGNNLSWKGKSITSNSITISTPDEPEFSVYYVVNSSLSDGDSDSWGEVTPGNTFTADVYVSADSEQVLQAFEIYPVCDSNLSWTAVSGVGYTATKEDTYFAFYNQNTENPTSITVTTAGTKVATLTFEVSEDAVYDTHMPIYFANTTNLAIAETAENAKLPAANIDTTGTLGVETLATVTVTFDGNGSTSGSMPAQSVPYNKATALTANTFAREDYNFLGWSENASATTQTYGDQASVTLKASLTLYAVWNQTHAAYTVEHWQQNAEDDNYTKVDADTETKKGEIGQQTEATANTYLGFTAQAITQETIVASGTVVEVYYDRNTYAVTYEYQTPIPDGAPSAPTEVAQRFGKLVQVQAKPTMTGYTLGDWSSEDVTVSDGKFTMPAKPVKLEAAWSANQYTVTLDPTNKGALPDGTSSTITVTYNDTWPALPNPTPSNGYEFSGWYNGDTQVRAGDPVTITDNMTLTAHYTPIDYTITFVYDNGTANSTKTYNIESTETLAAPSAKANYKFSGWTVTSAADGSSWAAKTSPLAADYALSGDYGDVTLTAVWELDAKIAVLAYAYAYGNDALLLVGGTPVGDGVTYLYKDQPLFKLSGDGLSAYQAKLGAEYSGDVYAYIVGTDGSLNIDAPVTVGTGSSEELVKNGMVNGDAVVNSADANAVFQMLVDHNVYTNAQLSVKGRLIADMVSDDGEANFGSIADVNAIIDLIKSAASAQG